MRGRDSEIELGSIGVVFAVVLLTAFLHTPVKFSTALTGPSSSVVPELSLMLM